jgi:hypothetical protein
MPWQALTGVVEWWADEGRRDLGRRRFNEARGGTPSGQARAPGIIDVVRALFAAQRHPWRLSEVALSTTNDHVTPAVASWADHATAVLRGTPAQQHAVAADETWGDLGLRTMLDPRALETLLPRPWPAQLHVPGDVLERDLPALPELVSLASDHYEIAYDADLDILTTWAAIIDGEVAQRVSLTHLTVVDIDANAARA